MRQSVPSILVALSLLIVAPVAVGAERVQGYAEFREQTFLVVDGQRIAVNGKTKFDGVRRFASIPLGYEVEARGERRPDGSLLARRVEVRRNQETSLETQMKASFDEMETLYRTRGRMATVDGQGRVVEDHGPLITDGPQVARARSIAADLVPPYVDPDDLRVYVVQNDEWNAMAAPNYSIYVFSGLLESMDDDEVAIVLGHELAHATHEHSRRQYKRSMWVQMGAVAGTVVAGEAFESGAASSAAQLGTVLAASAVVSGYSREHEDQADRVGLRYAHEAGYDVTRAPALWQRFAGKYGESGKTVNFFFGDHSRASRREQLLRSEIERNYTTAQAAD